MSSGLDKTFRRFTDQLVKPKPNSILYNRFVLYFVFFVALSNLFIAAFQQNYMFCTYFVLIGFILTFFNKNMTVVLVLTIAFANILSVSTGVSREGMDVKEGADDTLEYSEVDAEKTKDDKSGAKTDAKTDASASAKSDAKSDAKASAKTDAKGDKSKSQMVDDLKKDAEKLIDTQNKIIGGFEKIDPYMKQAEQLIQHIDTTAKKIESINKSKVEQFKG